VEIFVVGRHNNKQMKLKVESPKAQWTTYNKSIY